MAEWNLLERSEPVPRTPAQEAALINNLRDTHGYTEAQVRAIWDDELANTELWCNDLYTVHKRVHEPNTLGKPSMVHLSIRRNDRGTAKDWRDFQRIKNQLCGPEVEMCELYPAESRLVDTANQYHLWGYLSSEWRFPFGWDEGRHVSDQPADPVTNVRQRAPE